MAIDRVHPLKLEDPTTGGDQIDQFPTELNPLEDHIECAGLVLDDASNRDEAVRIYRDGDDMRFMDAIISTPCTLSDLLAGGMTEEQHRLLPSSNHWIDQDSYDEITRSGGKTTQVVTWDSPLKTRKIREEVITRTGGLVSQLVTSNYDGSGILHETLTEVITRTGGRVVNITRTRVLL
jgi:hypothetical protein